MLCMPMWAKRVAKFNIYVYKNSNSFVLGTEQQSRLGERKAESKEREDVKRYHNSQKINISLNPESHAVYSYERS